MWAKFLTCHRCFGLTHFILPPHKIRIKPYNMSTLAQAEFHCCSKMVRQVPREQTCLSSHHPHFGLKGFSFQFRLPTDKTKSLVITWVREMPSARHFTVTRIELREQRILTVTYFIFIRFRSDHSILLHFFAISPSQTSSTSHFSVSCDAFKDSSNIRIINYHTFYSTLVNLV